MTLRCRRRRRGPGRGGPRGPSGGGGARARVGARRGADSRGRGAGFRVAGEAGARWAVRRRRGGTRCPLARVGLCSLPAAQWLPDGGLPPGRGARPLPAGICLLSFPVAPCLGLILCLSFAYLGSRDREENSWKLEPHRSPVKMKVSGANSSQPYARDDASREAAVVEWQLFVNSKLISLLSSTFRKMTCEWVVCVNAGSPALSFAVSTLEKVGAAFSILKHFLCWQHLSRSKAFVLLWFLGVFLFCSCFL